MSRIVTTVTGWIVNQGAVDAYDQAYRISGDRENAMRLLQDDAIREGWARSTVAAAGKDWRTHLAKFDGTVLPRQTAVDWSEYRKCSQVCRAEIGEPCFSLSGTVAAGRPDGVRNYLAHPHLSRQRRTPRQMKA